MTALLLPAEGLDVKDPHEQRVYTMDWDSECLASGVQIASSAWTITGPDSTLTQDNAGILTGNRQTQLRLSGGTLGAVYQVQNQIVTNETPAQTKDRSFFVQIDVK